MNAVCLPVCQHKNNRAEIYQLWWGGEKPTHISVWITMMFSKTAKQGVGSVLLVRYCMGKSSFYLLPLISKEMCV